MAKPDTIMGIKRIIIVIKLYYINRLCKCYLVNSHFSLVNLLYLLAKNQVQFFLSEFISVTKRL